MAYEELKKNRRYQPIRHLYYSILDRVFGIAILNLMFSLLVRRLREEEGKHMNNKTLSLTIAAGSLIAGFASADYMGLDYEAQAYSGGIAALQGTWTAKIYALFSSETDQLNAVFGDGDNPLLVTTGGIGGFYQNPFGGSTSTLINPALYSAFPSLVYDSWVTIGLSDQVDNAMLNIGIDWTDFESNGGDISTDNGSWFATPDDIQGTAGADLRVMVGQFTMYGLNSSVSGVLNLQGKEGDFETFQAINQDFAIPWFNPPSPSAIALFGIAGFAIRRRRK